MPFTEGHGMTDLQIRAALASELDDAEPRRDLWPAIEAEALRRQIKPRWCLQLQAQLDRLGGKARRLRSKLQWLWPSEDWAAQLGLRWVTIDSAPRIAGGLTVLRTPRRRVRDASPPSRGILERPEQSSRIPHTL